MFNGPIELKLLIEESKNIHKALNHQKFRSKEEEDVYLFARSSVIAFRDIDKGKIIKEEDIWSRRPGSGEIPGYDFAKVIGKVAKSKILKNTQLKWDFFE